MRSFWRSSDCSGECDKSKPRLSLRFNDLSIDEVHLVGETVRGSVLEVVVSRVKALGSEIRFIALSATIPNVEDVASWLGESSDTAQNACFHAHPFYS